MTNRQPFRHFFTRSLLAWLLFVLLTEALVWVAAYDARLMVLNRAGGVGAYIGLLLKRFILPEVATIFVVSWLVALVHRRTKLNSVNATWLTLLRYELGFVPVLVLAFLMFDPFRAVTRFLLAEFPTYSFAVFWTNYIVASYSWVYSLRYPFAIFFIGYGALSVWLIRKASSNKRSSSAN
jgi:uncharacterized protein YqgC (DUF456 family)